MKSGRRLIVKKEFPCEDAARIHLDLMADCRYAVLDSVWCKKFAPELHDCVQKKIFEHACSLPWEMAGSLESK